MSGWKSLDLRHVDATFRDRFWSKVAIAGPDDCWEWQSYRKPNGYGQFTVSKGKFVTASRVALALTTGIVPAGIVACHHCDNPPCCNPAHLFAGSQRANAEDCVRKGRAKRAVGEDAGSARLTDEAVRFLRSDLGRQMPLALLAERYGVCKRTIWKARSGGSWRHLT